MSKFKHKTNNNLLRLFKQKEAAYFEFLEYGVKPIRYKATYYQLYHETWWEHGMRSQYTKSWKRHRKRQYK